MFHRKSDEFQFSTRDASEKKRVSRILVNLKFSALADGVKNVFYNVL